VPSASDLLTPADQSEAENEIDAPAAPVLRVQDLKTHFFTRDGVVKAVDGVSFEVRRGETLGVVGESGSGKSVTALSVMRLVAEPAGRIVDGRIELDGADLVTLPEVRMRKLRGSAISMIFQEPMTSLNPVLRIGYQLGETIRTHRRMGKREVRERALEMLRIVHIPEPTRRIDQYPFELSGGMRQRVMIAMALACNPKLLIADEATTALDVTIQAQILHLINELREKLGTAVMMITHDLGVVAETAQRVVVMYAGKVVEEAPVRVLFRHPLHPYTAGLLASIPRLPPPGRPPPEGARHLNEIPGFVPSLRNLPPGCRFAPRCPLVTERCRREQPPLERKTAGHLAACFESARVTDLPHG
jgi:peptide/nickel transport system ATP-binding protein